MPAGCAGEDTGPTEKAEATVATLLQTCAHGEGEAVLDLLTPPAGEQVIAAESVIEGCDRVLDLGVEAEVAGPTVFGEAVVEAVEVNDDLGTVTIRAPGGETSEVELENTGDEWLVSNPAL